MSIFGKVSPFLSFRLFDRRIYRARNAGPGEEGSVPNMEEVEDEGRSDRISHFYVFSGMQYFASLLFFLQGTPQIPCLL